MRPHWNRNHARNAEAANDRLRQRYEVRRENVGTIPFAVPDKLKRAIRGPSWSGEPVLVTANGRDVAAVLGTESTDAWAIWRDITAAVQAGEDTGTGVRLIPPAPFAEGLRAVAVPSGQQVVVWRSSAKSVTNRQRRIAARRALRALDGHVPPAVRLSLLVPRWRKAVPIATAVVAATVVAVLISTGQMWALNRTPSSPAVPTTRQPTAGSGHGLAPSAASSGPGGRRSSQPAAGGHARSRHRGTRNPSIGPASSSARASSTQPQPSPAHTPASPSPRATATKKCALRVLGVCVSR